MNHDKLKNKLDNYFNFKKNQILKNNYSPDNNNIKYLMIFASHCDSEIKLKTIKNNLKYFDYKSIDISFISSKSLKYNQNVKDICDVYKNITYYEIDNSPTCDFGKWINILNQVDYIKLVSGLLKSLYLIIQEKIVVIRLDCTVLKNFRFWLYIN